MSEGETISVVSGSTTYEVGLEFIDSTGVKFNINGDITNKLSKGETSRLPGTDSYIGVREINTQDYQGGIKNVDFSIGSGKLVLTNDAEIKLNDNTIQGVKAFLTKGSYTDGVQKVDKIVIQWTTDDEEFVAPGTELEMPGFGGVKFTMSDFVRSTEEKVVVQPDGDDSIEISVPIKDGTVSFNLLFSTSGQNAGNFTGIGKDTDERLATSASNTLTFFEKQNSLDYDAWFVASYNISSEAESYLLRAKINKNTDADRNETDIEKHDGSGWVLVCDDRKAKDSCDIGLVTLTIGTIVKNSTTESVVLTAGSDVNFNTIYTTGGLRIYLPYEEENSTAAGGIDFSFADEGTTIGNNADSWWLSMDGENKDDDIAAGQEFNMTLDATTGTGNPLQVSQVNRGGTGGPDGLELGTSNTYETYVVDDVAPRILHYTTADEDWAEVYYPTGNSESFGEVYLSEIGTTFTAGTAATTGAASLGDVVVKDSEVNSVSSKNLIIVGGSCINSAAATLLGGAYCGASFTDATGIGSGGFLIKGFDDSSLAPGKLALLVAGYDAADTVNAAQYLTNQKPDTSKAWEGTSSTVATEMVTEA